MLLTYFPDVDIRRFRVYNKDEEVGKMSEKEYAVTLLDKVPEYKLGYVVAYLQGLTADEAEDDEFCEMLLKESENEPEKGEVTLEELAEMCGVSIDEL